MKLLTLNFLTCAIKHCKPHPDAFPLHVRDAELELVPVPLQPLLLRNLLTRLDLAALAAVATELGLKMPAGVQESADMLEMSGTGKEGADEEMPPPTWMKELHTLLLETQIMSGKLVCGRCGHEYAIKEGIPNFLLPPHLVG